MNLWKHLIKIMSTDSRESPVDRRTFALDARLEQSLRRVAAEENRPADEMLAVLIEAGLEKRRQNEESWLCWHALTPREQDVAALMCLHYTNRQIAAQLGIAPDTLVMLFLGSGFRRKGLDGVIAALPEIRQAIPGARLIVAGKDRLGPYAAQASRVGVADGVQLRGPSEKVRELYAVSDLFVLPTFYDPFSNACLEAMASGLPVLTTRYNGVAEFIQERKNGFLVEPSLGGEEIASRVIDFWRSPDRNRFGEEARRSILHLDMNLIVPRVLGLYEKVSNE